jgi:hypothetical protein
MVTSHHLGLPRIVTKRQLKYALEHTAHQIRKDNL